jgi:hypothetical protein
MSKQEDSKKKQPEEGKKRKNVVVKMPTLRATGKVKEPRGG